MPPDADYICPVHHSSRLGSRKSRAPFAMPLTDLSIHRRERCVASLHRPVNPVLSNTKQGPA
jgi:hypothetical protein